MCLVGCSADESVCMQADVPKRKVKKTNIPVVELVYGGMAAADVQKAIESEYEMALQDRVMEETKDKKNAVEAYVYDMRNKVLKIFCFACRLVYFYCFVPFFFSLRICIVLVDGIFCNTNFFCASS